MGNTRKPRKAHRPKEIMVPMQSSTRDNLALELRLAIETLILAPSPVSYNTLSCMCAALMRSGVKGKAIDLATATLVDICDRYERVEKVGVSELEAVALREAAGGLDVALGKVALNKFREAVAAVTIHCTEMGI